MWPGQIDSGTRLELCYWLGPFACLLAKTLAEVDMVPKVASAHSLFDDGVSELELGCSDISKLGFEGKSCPI